MIDRKNRPLRTESVERPSSLLSWPCKLERDAMKRFSNLAPTEDNADILAE